MESVLGMGGMGVVVAARHVELQTRFALKLMRREAAADEESVARFLREARAAVRLKSQHCVRVVDVGRLDGGAPYMVMELLVGKNLGELVDASGARDPREAVDLILQACEGIAEAHSFGIVHRDIKPHNLFVTSGVDGRPLVKVLDFGLAKTLVGGKEQRALTNTTAVMGSPQYMSPEQMRASRTVDARSDTWSIGVCLYELLTGRTPFGAGTYPELCSMVLNDRPEPLPSDIPRGLAKAVLRCLEKDPKRRFPDVAELGEALEPFASTPGAAARIRAVLETPRPDLDAEPPGPLNDPEADTRTAASIDTERRGRTARAAWPAALAATVVLAGVGLLVGTRRATPSPAASAASSAVATSASSVGPTTTPAPREAAIEATVAPPPSSSAEPPSARPGRAHGVPPRRVTHPAPPTTTDPRASEPVLKPKTTEF